ncbi:hypothetical protein PHYBOEH_008652 [Phytophthora boehmeriae]|uniref:Uncharacterized protein n=1 Tax=Phytophthora boehmeriae TaxID=109152 RepID=A0A8T1X038_9STRA|nr:hypothetical protein PHYBOEH_008652 [Phytophthora boehmeriae]
MDSSYRASGRSGNGSERQERPASSPCPSSSSSSSQASSSSSASSASSSSDSSASSNSSNDSDDEPPPPANNSNGGRGGGNGKKKEEDDGNSSDSSSSDSSADESDLEEDDGVMLDTDDEKDKIKALSTKHDGVPPTDEDEVDSDGSSDLESAYPRLPSAPVDALIAFRRQAAHEELQLSDDLKKQVVADAKQRQQVRREQAQRARKKKKAPQSHKRRHSKQEEYATNGHSTNGSAGTANLKMSPQIITEDEWMVDCSCGLREKNYDDGTSMIQFGYLTVYVPFAVDPITMMVSAW